MRVVSIHSALAGRIACCWGVVALALCIAPAVCAAGEELYDIEDMIDAVSQAGGKRSRPGKDMARASRPERPAPRLTQPEFLRGITAKRALAEQRCGHGLTQTTPVEAQVEVAPEGTVSAVELATAQDGSDVLPAGERAAECVLTALRGARFRASPGGRFAVRLLVRGLDVQAPPTLAAAGVPEHLTHAAPQAPPARKAPATARSGKARPLPVIKDRVAVSDDPVAGLPGAGRAEAGAAARGAR